MAKSRYLQIVGRATDQLEILKFKVTFCLTVAIRAQTRTVIPFFINMIRNALKQNVQLALWFAETFSH